MPTIGSNDLTQGITDDYVDGPLNAAERLDNLLINRFKKPYQRDGIDIYSEDAPQIPPGNQKIDDLYYFDSTLFVKSGTKLYYIEDGDSAFTTLAGPSHDAFADSELGARCSWSEWRGHLVITPGPSTNKKAGCRTVKVYRNSSSVWTLHQAGLPRTEDGTTGGIYAETASTGTDYAFTFAYCFKSTYTAKVDGNNVEFIEFGTPTLYQSSGLVPINSTDRVQRGTLTYINGTYENYPTSSMVVSLFRTKADGTVIYFSQNVALGAQVDYTITDANLGEEFYAQSDEQYNDPVPLCYFSKIVDGYGWYFAADDIDGDFSNSRILQSNPLVPFGVPSGNSTYVEGKIRAADYATSFPLAFTRNKTYRIEGRLDTYGAGDLRAILVSDTYGAVSEKPASTSEGVYFASEQGFCYTNAFNVIPLSDHLRTTYAALNNKSNIYGAYDSKNKHVYFSVESPSYTANTNNQLIILDEFWTRQNGEMKGVFTTMSSQNGSADNLKANSLHYDSENDVMIIGHQNGYVMKFDSDKLTDPVVDTGNAYADWNVQGILPDYISVAMSMGSSVVSKWISRIFLIMKNLTGNCSLDILSHNDDKTSTKSLKVVRERTTTSTGLHKIKRWFPKGGLRCLYKQIQIKKGTVIIAASDDYDTLSVVTGSAVIDSGSWPTFDGENLVGFSLYLEDDDYTTAYPILTQSSDTLTVTGTLPAGSEKAWQIKGIPKNEDFEMHAFDLEYEMEQEHYTAYASGDDGSNS